MNKTYRFHSLDILRGFSIGIVFLYHTYGEYFGSASNAWGNLFRSFPAKHQAYYLPASLGWLGVSVFFVISGFCIQLSINKYESVPWTDFFRRRFFRIYPPYLFVLALLTFVWPIIFDSNTPKWTSFVSHALLIHNVVRGEFMQINPSFWSIAVEWQLYILFPVFIFLARKFSFQKVFWTICILEVSLRSIQEAAFMLDMKSIYWPLNGFTPIYWFSWLIGAEALKKTIQGVGLPTWRWMIWLSLGVFASFFKPLYTFSFLFTALATADILRLLILNEEKLTAIYESFFFRIVSMLGMISYSFYLIHQPIVGLVSKYLKLSGFIAYTDVELYLSALLFGSFSISFVVSFLLYKYVEVPSQLLGKAKQSVASLSKQEVI